MQLFYNRNVRLLFSFRYTTTGATIETRRTMEHNVSLSIGIMPSQETGFPTLDAQRILRLGFQKCACQNECRLCLRCPLDPPLLLLNFWFIYSYVLTVLGLKGNHSLFRFCETCIILDSHCNKWRTQIGIRHSNTKQIAFHVIILLHPLAICTPKCSVKMCKIQFLCTFSLLCHVIFINLHSSLSCKSTAIDNVDNSCGVMKVSKV